MNVLRRLWKKGRRPLAVSYDSYNHEVQQIVTPNLHTDIRLEITKTIFPFFQISSIKTSETAQTFLTLSSKNGVLQFSFDGAQNYQLKSSVLIGPLITKFRSIVSHKKEVFTQVETMLNSKFHSLVFKLVSPTFSASNLIYVVTYFVSTSFLNCGVEVVGQNNELGVSFTTRVEGKNSVYCANLQKFNTLVLSFYRRIFGFLELGAEVTKTPTNTTWSGGARIRNYRTDVKCCVDANYSVGFNWCESLTENLKVEFSSSYDWKDFEYGVALCYES